MKEKMPDFLGHFSLKKIPFVIFRLRRQAIFRDATTRFPRKGRLSNERRNSVLMTFTAQIWVMVQIGRVAREICFNQSEALRRSG